MTSGVFRTIPLASITVNRAERQRRTLEKVEELAASIKANGLINPLVVTPEYELVAGERRLSACRLLGWLEVPVQLTTDLDTIQLHLIELEENTKRVDLSWQDNNDAVARYHKLKQELDPAWTQDKTADALGLSKASISTHLLVADQRKTTPAIESAEKLSVATNLARRKVERQKNAVIRELAIPTESPNDEPPRFADIQTASFHEWARTYTGALFNLIHCDFPYGVNTGDKAGQSAAKHLGSYADGEDVYFALLETMAECLDNFVAPSAHLIFWYSMKFHKETVEALEAMGWSVDPFPLIWLKSDNAGMLPDPNRGPRRVYETALFASRGDRKVVRPVSNAIALPTTKDFHTSEKPYLMLEHFFRMLVDDTTRLLDPTCGSGMAVRVGEAAGASFSLGLEMNEEFAERARVNCKL